MVWLLVVSVLALLTVLGYPLLEVLIWRRLWLQRLSYSSAIDQNERKAEDEEWSSALLYLSGISYFASADLLHQQVMMVEQAATVVHPDRCIIRAFPYDPQVAQTFRRIDLWPRLGFLETPLLISSLRNFWQAWLASWLPNWYGAAVARCLCQQLGAATAPRTLVVIGNSAGAAILLSAAPHLRKTWPSLCLTTIMCGGVFGESQGFDEIDLFHQLLGEEDSWPKLATLIFPRRQSMGAWQRANQTQRYQERVIGPMAHFGSDGYYSDKYLERTCAFIVTLLQDRIHPPGVEATALNSDAG